MAILSTIRSLTKELTGYFVYLLLVASLGPFLFGYHLSELNAPQDVITCQKRSIGAHSNLGLPQCIPMNPTELGLVSSIFTLGGLVGALTAGPASSKYGRLLPMRLTTAFFMLGAGAETFAPNIAILSVGRLISGIGAGASLVTVPIYISEIAPPKEKGFFGSFTQISINTGIFLTQFLGFFLSHDSMWRIILAVGGLIGLLQLFGLVFAVDSPSWKASLGQIREAHSDLRHIRGKEANLSQETENWDSSTIDEDGESERQTLLNEEQPSQVDSRRKSLRARKENLGIFEIFADPNSRWATMCVMVVMVAQQFCGINSIMMYGVSLLSNLLAAQSALLVIFVSVVNIIVTTACAPLVDILGRKKCLLISIAGMGTSSILLGIGIRSSTRVLSAVAVILFVMSFGAGLGPVPFMLSSELVGSEAVGATQSWALAANWIATFVIAQFFPIVNDKLGSGVIYFIFAGLAAFFFLFVTTFVPETKGKKDADEVWGRKSIGVD